MPLIQADTILFNGSIWTCDDLQPMAEALAVFDGRILAVGSTADILQNYTSDDCIDLQGRRVLPGLHDSHMHLVGTGMFLMSIDLTGTTSIGELVERFRSSRQYCDRVEGFLIGRGFLHDEFYEKTMPTCKSLDAISHERPIVAVRACGHVLVCNSKVLELAGVSKGFGQVDGGEIGYFSDGEPNGVFSERAMNLIYSLQPDPSEDEVREVIAIAASEILRSGVTTAHTNDFDSNNYELLHRAYSAAMTAGNLRIRLNHQLLFEKPEDIAEFVKWRNEYASTYNFDPEYFCYGPVKIMCDGSLGARTAAMREPYADDPGNNGVAILNRGQMTAILREAYDHGFQLCGHAIGDLAISDLVEAIGEVVPPEKRQAARSRVIHAQITTPDILARMRELSIHCDIQPPFVATDYIIVASRVGEKKAQTSYAWATMRRMGITTSGGSDSPVEDHNPFYGIYCAVTRQTSKGDPPSGWQPEERLSVEEALYLYTRDGAYAIGMEDVSGSLKPGYYADFIVLDRDILNIPHEEIKNVRVCSTWVGGKKATSIKEEQNAGV